MIHQFSCNSTFVLEVASLLEIRQSFEKPRSFHILLFESISKCLDDLPLHSLQTDYYMLQFLNDVNNNKMINRNNKYTITPSWFLRQHQVVHVPFFRFISWRLSHSPFHDSEICFFDRLHYGLQRHVNIVIQYLEN